MPSIKCKLLSHSNSPHIQQLFTGFKMLGDTGLIEVIQEFSRGHKDHTENPQFLRRATHAHLQVELSDNHNQRFKVYFDNHDAKEINEQHLNSCDIYFKRSFSCDYISEFHPEKKGNIFPLGLNYLVLYNGIDLHAIKRGFHFSSSINKKIRNVLTSIDTRNKLAFRPRLRNIQSLPEYTLEPKVLFMATAHDPYDTTDRPKEKIEERIHNNEFRANCIRILRKELGSRFYGGFIHNKYTLEKHKDVLIDNASNAKKENYLEMLGKFPICIATTGLHGSIGWKLAEYVAFSKAIITERLQYKVPGPFLKNKNYLEFSSPEECAQQSIKLLDDHNLLKQIITRNFEYYKNYVKPDMLILNALTIAIEKWKK